MRRIVDGDLDVACPLCKAKAGDGCINMSHGTRFAGEVHRERRRAAEEARSE